MSSSARKARDSVSALLGEGLVSSAAKRPRDRQVDQLADQVIEEMLTAWNAGFPIAAEQWLEEHPQIAGDAETAVLIIYEEICLREEAGERVDSTEILGRFPRYRDPLRVVLDGHRLVRTDTISFPEAGDELGELKLLRELGRGSAGRVFLAVQPSLSDRRLVVKLIPRAEEEHLNLSRLQHTHIVPLYLVEEFPERNLRALCMPYLGGATWAALLLGLHSWPLSQRSGQHIVRLLDSQNDARNRPVAPAAGFLQRSTYIEATCWIGACLADALHYAHERGLIHLDVKPSNVLVAADGQPMLLDFHLARNVTPGEGAMSDRVGGTRGYFSPEQEAAFESLRAGAPTSLVLDRRSDVYSLGVLLYESLGGGRPEADPNRSRFTLRKSNHGVSRGLEDIVHKCLQADATQRYATAALLADDLRRHLAGMPLRGVANRSWAERLRKWRRRRPYALVLPGVLTAAAVVLGLAFALLARDRIRLASDALVEARQEIDARDYAAAVIRLNAGLRAIRYVPGMSDLRGSLTQKLASAKQGRVAGALHELVDQLRFIDAAEQVPVAELADLDKKCAELWQARRQLLAVVAPDRSPSAVKTDLIDFAQLWTRLHLRLPDGALPVSRAGLQDNLDQAEAISGPSLVLELARFELQTGAEHRDLPPAISAAATTSWEFDVIGRHYLHAGFLAKARSHCTRAVELNPGGFWPNFHLLECMFREGRYDEALPLSFVCVALAPQRPESYLNRALCLEALGRDESAVLDAERVLAIDPRCETAISLRKRLTSRKKR